MPPEFLVLNDPRVNPLITLLQVAKLHTAQPWQGVDLTVGDVADDAERYMAFTYTGSPESFWDGLMRLVEMVIIDAEGLSDDRYPGQCAFARLHAYGLPPLEVLSAIGVDADGSVVGDPAWEELE